MFTKLCHFKWLHKTSQLVKKTDLLSKEQLSVSRWQKKGAVWKRGLEVEGRWSGKRGNARRGRERLVLR